MEDRVCRCQMRPALWPVWDHRASFAVAVLLLLSVEIQQTLYSSTSAHRGVEVKCTCTECRALLIIHDELLPSSLNPVKIIIAISHATPDLTVLSLLESALSGGPVATSRSLRREDHLPLLWYSVIKTTNIVPYNIRAKSQTEKG